MLKCYCGGRGSVATVTQSVNVATSFSQFMVVQSGNAVDHSLMVRVCIQSGSLPSSYNSQLVCTSSAGTDLLSANSTALTKYFLYPRPGPWFIGFQADCSNTSTGYVTVLIIYHRLHFDCHFPRQTSLRFYRFTCPVSQPTVSKH